MFRAVLYARTAAADPARIAEQFAACRNTAVRAGWRVESEHSDDGRGATSTDRSGLRAALSALGPDAVLVVSDLARLARDMSDLVAIANDIEACRASLHCVDGTDINAIRAMIAPETGDTRLARRRNLAQRARTSN